MNLIELDKELTNKSVKGVYFFYGEEQYDVERYVEKIKKTFTNIEKGVNFFEIDKSNIKELSDAIEGVSFFGEDKLVVINNTELKFDVELLKDITNDKLIVVILEKSVDKRTVAYKTLTKIAKCVEFAKQNEKDAAFFVIRTLGAYKIKVGQETAEYMVNVCTENKQILVNEFRKIVAYLNEGDTLTKEIVDKLVVKTIDAKVFDLTDLIFAKKTEEALKLFDDLISSKVYVGVIESLIFKQIKNMYLVKKMKQDRYYSTTDIAKELGIHPFVYSKILKVLGDYSEEHLENLLLEFERYDEYSKIGKMDQIVGMKKIILSI